MTNRDGSQWSNKKILLKLVAKGNTKIFLNVPKGTVLRDNIVRPVPFWSNIKKTEILAIRG